MGLFSARSSFWMTSTGGLKITEKRLMQSCGMSHEKGSRERRKSQSFEWAFSRSLTIRAPSLCVPLSEARMPIGIMRLPQLAHLHKPGIFSIQFSQLTRQHLPVISNQGIDEGALGEVFGEDDADLPDHVEVLDRPKGKHLLISIPMTSASGKDG